MRKIVINGPNKLSGTVQIQGAKNSSMKQVLLPLLGDEPCTISNVPHIGSIDNLLEIVDYIGASYKWLDENRVVVDPKGLDSKRIPAKLFLYTSAGIHLIPILTSKFGFCEVESDDGTYGGDRIGGTRTMNRMVDSMNRMGFLCSKKGNVYIFRNGGNVVNKVEFPIKSFADTINAILAAMGLNKELTIMNTSEQPELFNIIKMLKRMGAVIEQKSSDKIIVREHKGLKGIEYSNFCDRGDLVTWVAIALITKSHLRLLFKDIKSSGLDAFLKFLDEFGVDYFLNKNFLEIKSKQNLKNVDIEAFIDPDFMTDWQPLIGPVLTQVRGNSTINELAYTDRLRYWEELGKMGIQYEFFRPKNCRFNDDLPHAVRVEGVQKLRGAKVKALDVRAGAAIVIAGLAAEGRTEISDIDHIERGYEDLVGRLKSVGADIDIIN